MSSNTVASNDYKNNSMHGMVNGSQNFTPSNTDAFGFQRELLDTLHNVRAQSTRLDQRSEEANIAYKDDLGLSGMRLEGQLNNTQNSSNISGVGRAIPNNNQQPNLVNAPNRPANVNKVQPAPNKVENNPTGNQGQQTGAGYQLLDEALKQGAVTFDKGDEQVLYNYLGNALTKSPTMLKDFIGDLNKGNTYSFGYRDSGEPSFATLNTNKNRIEFNSQDLFERAPYGPDEVAYHELYHSIYDVDHGKSHNAYIAKAIQEAGLQRVR